MSRVIIFGIKDFAEIAHFYLSRDGVHDIEAFVVHEAYLPKERKFKKIPIVSLETIKENYPPMEFKFFAPMSSIKMNTVREDIYLQIKSMGYSFISYISPTAVINNAKIGDNCFIQDNTVLEPFSKIGNNVMIWSNNTIGHHSVIEDHVSITSQVVIAGHCNIGKYSFLGANSTVRNGLQLSEGSLVGISSLITHSTEPWSVYMGNPARRIGKNISKSILTI